MSEDYVIRKQKPGNWIPLKMKLDNRYIQLFKLNNTPLCFFFCSPYLHLFGVQVVWK